jgi:dihydrofolate synthase/folylpolyglutamate synthase
MSYKGTIEYLYGLQKYGMKFGLDNISKLLSAAGNPHESFRAVHVAGTNGKGSTSSMTESILRTGGVRTGLFTSPHLVSFTERIRIDGEEIAEGDVIALAEEVRGIAEGMDDFSPTFFEVVTAMAFLHFRRMKVDWAVVETGLGGRLDATNVVRPEVSVITSIGLDHREFLGGTLREIAGEKAGIIKEKVPVVSSAQPPEAADVLARRAGVTGSAFFLYPVDFSSETVSETPGSVCFDYHGSTDYRRLDLPLAGGYQAVNASVAVKTIEVISEKHTGLRCNVREGLARVRWPGRLELIRKDPPVLIDGAHNPEAARSLSLYLEKLRAGRYRRIVLIAGIMGDKDIEGILAHLLPHASETIFTAPSYGRAAPAGVLASYASSLGYSSRETRTVAEAMALAEDLYLPGDIIVVTGSFYTIGEAREILGQRGVLSRLRE